MSADEQLYMEETKQGGWRGRSVAGDIGPEMFPEKYEYTDMVEDPDEVDNDRRAALRDVGTDLNNLFEHEEPRYNTYAQFKLNMREFGTPYQTMPWANEDFDTQFHDPDPRGTHNLPDMQELTRQMSARYRRTAFSSDAGDGQIIDGAIHPATLFAKIRATQDWMPKYMQWFETSMEGYVAGGGTYYPNKSNIYKYDTERKDADEEGYGELQVWRPDWTTKISNNAMVGGKYFIANSTPDHRVPVAKYGMMLGLASTFGQRQWDGDFGDQQAAQAKADRLTNVPRSVIAYMRSQTAVAEARQDSAGAGEFARDGTKEGGNRKIGTVGDILAVAGMGQHEIKIIEFAASKNDRKAVQMLGDLRRYAEFLEQLSSNERLDYRDQLLSLHIGGGGKRPDVDIRGAQNKTVINPKVVSHMALQTRKAKKEGDTTAVKRMTDVLVNGQSKTLSPYSSVKNANIYAVQRAAQGTARPTRGSHGVVNYRAVLNDKIQAVQRQSNADGMAFNASDVNQGLHFAHYDNRNSEVNALADVSEVGQGRFEGDNEYAMGGGHGRASADLADGQRFFNDDRIRHDEIENVN